MKFNLKKVALLLVMALLVGCGTKNTKDAKDTSNEQTESKLEVYASVYPVYDFAKKIGGDKVEVKNIVPIGMEPHDFEPSQADIKNLENAKVFVYNGAGLESWTDKVIESLDNKDIIVIEASHGVDLISGHSHEHEHHHDAADANHDHEENGEHNHEANGEHNHENHNHNEAAENHNEHEDHDHHHHHGAYDPHTWLSPKNAIIELKNIAEGLIKADPENEAYYKENLEKYTKEFEELDKLYSEEISKLPNKAIVVSHEAFGYICRDYGLTQMGIQGVEAHSEPTPAKMAEIVKFVKENNVNTIFTEELIDPKVAEVIAKETGAQTRVLNPIEGLSQEELDNGDEYVSVMKANLQNLIEALK